MTPREVSSIHRPTLTQLLEALEFLNDHEEWYERHPKITITEDVIGRGLVTGFTAVIETDVEEDEEEE